MWYATDRPGYMGTSRDEIHEIWNKEYGKDNWRIAWQWGKNIIQRPQALQIYEDGYYEFFKLNKGILEWLVKTASNVYDTSPSNVQSVFDYNIQETQSTHLHDIAIRKAVLRNGAWFKGDHLMHVRPDQEGAMLGPQMIPFHLPDMIYRGETKYKGKERDFYAKPPWWITMGIKDSVEEFYQQNKVLQVR